jgi:hypothetical protein
MSVTVGLDATFELRQFRIGDHFGPPAQIRLDLRSMGRQLDVQRGHVTTVRNLGGIVKCGAFAAPCSAEFRTDARTAARPGSAQVSIRHPGPPPESDRLKGKGLVRGAACAQQCPGRKL